MVTAANEFLNDIRADETGTTGNEIVYFLNSFLGESRELRDARSRNKQPGFDGLRSAFRLPSTIEWDYLAKNH